MSLLICITRRLDICHVNTCFYTHAYKITYINDGIGERQATSVQRQKTKLFLLFLQKSQNKFHQGSVPHFKKRTKTLFFLLSHYQNDRDTHLCNLGFLLISHPFAFVAMQSFKCQHLKNLASQGKIQIHHEVSNLSFPFQSALLTGQTKTQHQ